MVEEDGGVPAEVLGEDDKGKTGRLTAHFTAGLLAGIVSRTLTAPLDRLKILAQIRGEAILPIAGMKMMVKEGGITSMWRGNGTNLLKIGPEMSSKFLVYNEVKNWMMTDESDVSSTTQRLVAGFFAGALSHSIIHPIEVCKTRLVLRRTGENGSLWRLAKSGYNTAGIRFFFKGFKMSILGIASFTCVDFATYEKLKSFWTNKTEHIGTSGIFICGTMSSLTGIAICFPLGVIGVNLQATDEKPSFRTMMQFMKRRGIRGMYSGISTAAMKGVPTFALSYLTYEHVVRYLGHTMI